MQVNDKVRLSNSLVGTLVEKWDCLSKEECFLFSTFSGSTSFPVFSHEITVISGEEFDSHCNRANEFFKKMTSDCWLHRIDVDVPKRVWRPLNAS